MAIEAPTRESTETAARIAQLIRSLPDPDQERFLNALDGAIEAAEKSGKHRLVWDVIQAYLGLVLARSDPNYRRNMARGDEALGETFSLEDVKQRFDKRSQG